MDNAEKTVNLDHHIPSASLLSASEYQRVPKSEEAQLHKKESLEYRDFLPDSSGLSVWERLRKPEFQRATNGWTDEKIKNLLETLRQNQVIPGVIFWLNTQTGHIFVLDGAHRLSSIRAWITDDWGDSTAAKEYGYVEDGDILAAGRMRHIIEESIGSFTACQEAGKRYKKLVDDNKVPSDSLDEVTEARGKFMYTLNTSLRIPIQWVTGDYKTAEQSFLNINTGGTALSESEVLYLTNRRSPVARAITGIASNGTKPNLFLQYQEECETLSRDIYALTLAPSDIVSPIRVADYPLCFLRKQKNFERYLFLQSIFSVVLKGETGERNLKNIMENLADENDDSIVGAETLNILRLTKKALSHLYGSQSQSLGLYPAFYYYMNKGQYKEFFFLLFTAWISKGTPEEILQRKLQFTLARDLFEEVWMLGKDFVFQAYSRKGAGSHRLTLKHVANLQTLIDMTSDAKKKSLTAVDVLDQYLKVDLKVHADFMRQYEQESGKPFARFSESTKVQGEFMTLFHSGTPRCATCGGRILIGSHQVDHIVKRSKGGSNSHKNADLKHPFCNNHRDKLEGLQLYFAGDQLGQDEQLDILLPSATPDPESREIITQLRFFSDEETPQ